MPSAIHEETPAIPGAGDGPNVFVSYASVDRARVIPIAEALRAAGVDFWLDVADIDDGMSYGPEIVEGIKGCGAVHLEGLAGVAVRRDLALEAATLLGAAAALRETAGMPLMPTHRLAVDADTAAAKAALDPETFAAAWNVGRVMSLDQAVAEAGYAGEG